MLAGEASGVVDTEGCLGGQLLDEEDVVLVERIRILPAQQGDHPCGHTPRPQGDNEVGVHAYTEERLPA